MKTFQDYLADIKKQIREVEPAQVQGGLAAASRPAVIDIREPDEWAKGIIPGAANVITGNELTVDVVLVGRIQTQDLFCGDAMGMILKPIVLDIAGSTVGAVRVEPGMVGDDLPPPVSACPE